MATAKKAPAKPKVPTTQELAARYGYAITFFNSDPELKALLAKAQKANWDVANFQAAIRNTRWWKARSDAQRNFDIGVKTDPGEWKRRAIEARVKLQQQAAQMGVTVSASWLTKMANQFVRNGATDQEIAASLASVWHSQFASDQEAASTGTAGDVVGQLREMASAYGYPLGDDRLNQQVTDVLAGNKQPKDYEETYKMWAKKNFAGVADLIDAGQTVADILDPYTQIASQELGKDKAAMLPHDPKWQKALLGANGGPMSLSDWRTTIRTESQYGWDQSRSAQDDAYKLAAGLSQMFQGG